MTSLRASLVAAGLYLLANCAHVSPTTTDELADRGMSAAVECVAGPAMACPWASGWTAYRDCLRREVLPCVGEHLAATLPVLADLWGGLSVRYAGLQAGSRVTAGLAGVDACIMALPEPATEACGDVSLDRCGAAGVAWCAGR